MWGSQKTAGPIFVPLFTSACGSFGLLWVVMTVTEVNSITIYHNSRCSKSRAAVAYVEEKCPEASVTIINYLDTPPSRDELASLLQRAELKPADAIRRGEKEFKELGLSSASTDDELLDAMASHPRLIERPIVATNNGVRIARPTELIEEIL